MAERRLIARLLDLPDDAVGVLDRRGRDTATLIQKPAASMKAGVVCRGGALPRIRASVNCFRLRRMTLVAAALQIGLSLLGAALAAVLLLSGDGLGAGLLSGLLVAGAAVQAAAQSLTPFGKL